MTEYGRIHTDGSRSGGQPMLEPCPVPWCGSSDVKARSFDANHRRHWIECGKCNFKTPQMPSRTKVITLWNTRQPAQSDALRDQTHVEAAQALWNSISDDYNGWAHLSDIERDNIALALSAHHQHGYDQGYYDGQRDRQLMQDDALREALVDLLHAVCGKTGFAETVRRDSGRIYPWPALDLAEAKALEALEQSK